MSKPTWGLYITGYSSPSPAQERAFARMYPSVVAWHQMEVEQREREERQRGDQVRRRHRAALASEQAGTTIKAKEEE